MQQTHDQTLRGIAATTASVLGLATSEDALAWAAGPLAGAMDGGDDAGLLVPAEHWHAATWSPACLLVLADRALVATRTTAVTVTELPYATAGGLREHGGHPGDEPRAVFATGGEDPVFLRVPVDGGLPGLLVAAFAGRLDLTPDGLAAARPPRRRFGRRARG